MTHYSDIIIYKNFLHNYFVFLNVDEPGTPVHVHYALFYSRSGKYKKKLKRNKKNDRNVAGPAGDYDMSRNYPGDSHVQDTRYADMAPK